jgi:hypothetical protein
VEREEENLAQKRQSLAQKEDELEAQRAEILQIVSRLQGMMRREANNLQDLTEPSASAPAEQPSTESAPESEEREKSTQEWIDSLFPNRLGAGDAPSANSTSKPSSAGATKTGSTKTGPAAASESSSTSSESRSQFEAIKEDVQERTSSQASSSPSSSSSSSSSNETDDEDKPSTSELERIWDIFDES